MRIELCRTCGTEMKPCEQSDEKCHICKKVVKSFCPSCRKTSIPQIHQHLVENRIVIA